ncbi:hypothetical protein F4801DRAFT_556263 [Xylaria longipes]|nr:hypothetical protein F4801DRAFT_556263 [Xylaria longipes]
MLPPEDTMPLVLTREGIIYHRMVGAAIIESMMGEGLVDEDMVKNIKVKQFLIH